MAIFNSILGNILKVGIKTLGKGRLPKYNGALNIPGLRAKVEINWDNHGVPHIFAENLHDLYFTQGYIHAQDRLWQMELNRRTARGTLSEIFGELALETDIASRTFGFDRIGKEDWEHIDSTIKDIIVAYTKGVNAFMNNPNTKYPIEFSLIKHVPNEWDVFDTLALSRLMIWQLSHAWYGEIIRTKLIEAVGEEHAADLEITYSDNPITLPNGIEFNMIVNGELKKVKGPFTDRSMGSNSWVISGKLTDTGKPILSNDMHLPMSLPSLWYQIHLRSKETNVTGVSIPGLPMVLVGHNEYITWGMTLAFTDAEDLYVEKLNPDKFGQYRYKGEWRDAEVIKEEFIIKGKNPHYEKIIITNHGPIISKAIHEKTEAISVESMALRPNNALRGWYRLNTAKNWNDFVAAVRDIEAPQLNTTYADVHGNIGYWCTGKVPIRKKGKGKVPAPGWNGDYEWVGFVPFEEMPHSFNPESGYIITTNNKIVDDDYPHFLGDVWMNGYRAKVIEDIIKSKEKISIDDCINLQMNETCLPGIEFIKHLNDIEINDPDYRVNEAFELLKNWDGQLHKDSVAGAIYEVMRYMTVKNLLEPNLGKHLTNVFMGEGFHPVLLGSHEFYGHDTVVMLRMLEQPDSWWVKHAGGKEKLLRKSFNQAYEWLRDNVNANYQKWQWGKIHSIEFAHSMSIQKPMDIVFNRGPYPVGGDTDTPNQMAILPQDPFMVKNWAPSWRMVIDLGDIANSKAIYAPGQSGQIGSKHYDDLIEHWLHGNFLTMLWTRGQIERELKGTVNMEP